MICKTDGCGKSTVGQSKYCREHRADARKRFKEMLADKAEEKNKREVEFQELWNRACEAGRQAATTAKPQMITAVDQSGRAYEPFPICGFAWTSVRPGNSAFANWLKKNGHADTDSYSGGVKIWISDYGQSYDLKYAHASAMAKIFSEAGIKSSASGRLD